MNINRLDEIVHSRENIEIIYKKHPVWIEDFNKIKEVVEIKTLDTNEILVVDVAELVDTGKVIGIKH